MKLKNFTKILVALLLVGSISIKEANAANFAGICNGQFVTVTVHRFLFWSWGHVEDGFGNEIDDDCGLVSQAEDQMGWN